MDGALGVGIVASGAQSDKASRHPLPIESEVLRAEPERHFFYLQAHLLGGSFYEGDKLGVIGEDGIAGLPSEVGGDFPSGGEGMGKAGDVCYGPLTPVFVKCAQGACELDGLWDDIGRSSPLKDAEAQDRGGAGVI
jgi:hypothetical protein